MNSQEGGDGTAFLSSVACTTARESVVEFVAIGWTRAFGCPAQVTGLKKPPKL
jgi:hypothetical protein